MAVLFVPLTILALAIVAFTGGVDSDIDPSLSVKHELKVKK